MYLAATLLLATLLPATQPQSLADLRDRARVLLVFAPSDRDPIYQQQLTLLHNKQAEMNERDLVVVPILAQQGTPTSANTLRSLGQSGISNDEQLATRQRYHVGLDEFAAILLGKDGGEKLRSKIPISTEKLTTLIDTMPMRKDEIRARKQ